MNRFSRLGSALLVLALGVSFQACDNDDDNNNNTDPVSGLTLVADTTVAGTRFEVFSAGGLHTGDNLLTFRLITGTTPVSDAQLHLHPLMHMESMEHACPVGEVEELSGVSGLYTGHVMFTMPSGMMGSWSLGLQLVPATGPEIGFDLHNLSIADSPWQKSFSVIQGETTLRYFVALSGLEDPVVGTNPVELWVARKENNMLWPAVDSLVTTVSTLMPSMGHGSSGNVAPAFVADGRYSGVVGFNMSGDWQVTYGFRTAAGDSLGQAVFTFEF